MSQKITVVTCTGGRPELFGLCRRWVLRQKVQPTRWIVTTDFGDEPFAPEAEVYAVPPRRRAHAAIMAAHSMAFALSLVGDDSRVVVMEDDDWYGPRYIEHLVGADGWCSHQSMVHMYHLPSKRYSLRRYVDPVVGMLSFKAGNVRRIAEWMSTVPRPPLGSVGVESMMQLVKIKGVGFGLPGRAGATRKHITGHEKIASLEPDPELSLFRNLLGPDAEDYISLLQ